MKDGFGEITEEITDERKDYISYKMEIIFLHIIMRMGKKILFGNVMWIMGKPF